MCVNCSKTIKCDDGQNCVNGFCGDYISGYKFITQPINIIPQDENQNPNDCLNACNKNSDCGYWDLTKNTDDISKTKYSCNLYGKDSCSLPWNNTVACHKDAGKKLCSDKKCNIIFKKYDGKTNKKCQKKIDCYTKDDLDGLTCVQQGNDTYKSCHDNGEQAGICTFPNGSTPDGVKINQHTCVTNKGTWYPTSCEDVTDCTLLTQYNCKKDQGQDQGECIDKMSLLPCKEDKDCNDGSDEQKLMKCTTDNYCQGPGRIFPSPIPIVPLPGTPSCSGNNFDFPYGKSFQTVTKMLNACKDKQKGSDCSFTDFSTDNKVVYAKCDTIKGDANKDVSICSPDLCVITGNTTYENPQGVCDSYTNIWKDLMKGSGKPTDNMK
jgi:hypothetical protein